MPTKVFISYSHDSAEYKARVLALADRLRQNGVDCGLDQYEPAPPGGWPQWTMRMIEDADLVLVVCSEKYAQRFEGRERAGIGRGAAWEGEVIQQEMYEERKEKFVPVVFSTADVAHVPTVLRGQPRFVLDSDAGYWDLYRRLTNQPAVVKPEIGTLVPLPPKSPRSFQPAKPQELGVTDERREGTIPPPNPDPVKPPARRVLIASALVGVVVLVGLLVARLIPRVDGGGTGLASRTGGQELHGGLITHTYARVMPLALHYNIDTALRPQFYWLKVRMKNPDPERKTLTVSCEVTSNPHPFVCNPREVGSRTVEPKGEATEVFTPRLEPTNTRLDVSDDNTRVTLQWEVRDERGAVLDSHSYEVLVAPRNYFYWSLTAPEGGTVSTEFLLASLSAWMWSVPEGIPPSLREAPFRSPEDLIERARSWLFAGSGEGAGITLTPGMPEFPPSDRIKVLTPQEVLERRTANALEAALLLAAVTAERFKQSGIHLALITAAQTTPEARRVYLAWYSAASEPWSAIELTTSQSFADNVRTSSGEIAALIPSDAIDKLKADGVYVRESGKLTALDFGRAKDRFRIQGLP